MFGLDPFLRKTLCRANMTILHGELFVRLPAQSLESNSLQIKKTLHYSAELSMLPSHAGWKVSHRRSLEGDWANPRSIMPDLSSTDQICRTSSMLLLVQGVILDVHHYPVELLPKPVGRTAKQHCPPRNTFSVVFVL